METRPKQLTQLGAGGPPAISPVAAVCDRRILPQGRGGSPSGPKPPALIAPSPHVGQASRLRSSPNPAGETPALHLAAPPSHNSYLLNPKHRSAAFTLVESVVAIGLFAFVITGIVGLFGSTLERSRLASFETRSVLVSQQILARIRAADSAQNVAVTRGTSTDTQPETKLFHPQNFTTTPEVAFYYKVDGTEISGLTPTDNYKEDSYSPFPGYDADGKPEDIVGRALATFSNNGTGSPNLYRVTIEVSEPFNLPHSARRYTKTFTTFATFPN